MLTSDLKAAAAKLQREQKERTEREQQRLEKERILKARAAQRQAQREEEARQRRLEQEAAAEAEAERRAAELEHNRGIYLRMSLAAAPAHTAAAIARGIKRAADKLVLPPSAGSSLMDQGAPKNGAMFFEVAAPNGARTHAGVLEFTAPEGVVLLPEKVCNCLWGLPGSSSSSCSGGSMQASQRAQGTTATPGISSSGSPVAAAAVAAAGDAGPRGSGGGSGSGAPQASTSGRCCGQVSVSYQRLEKGTYVRFQPELKAFHEEVGADPDVLRLVLEEALLTNCTLTEGDWIQVHHNGREHNLRVLELQPQPAVSIIDTDLAADVGPSIETEGYLRAREEALAREQERLRLLEEQREQLAAEALAAADAARKAAEAQAAEDAARRLRVQAEKAALVREEPAADSAQPQVVCMFRLPDGNRLVRRFLAADPVQALMDYVDSKGAGGMWPGTYQLVLQYPRATLPSSAASLMEVGLEVGKQYAVFLEPLSAGGGEGE